MGAHVGRGWAVEATWTHISNAHLRTGINPGMDDLGVRVVKRFGG